MATLNDGFLLTPLTPSMPACPPIVENIETLPITPPDSAAIFAEKCSRIDSKSVKKALHVLSTERDALTHLENLYATSTAAQRALSESISFILASQSRHGKVIFTGVGKSGWIAQKLVATFNSVGIVAVFLHPTEALHGDLGVIRPNDVVIMITFSGKTQELLTLLPHIPSYVPLMIMTSHLVPETCPLLTHPRREKSNSILLSAPIHVSEKEVFGLSAPTASTTVALALGDGIALVVADRMHTEPERSPADVFCTNHPGGAIGAANSPVALKMSDIAVQVDDIHTVLPSAGREVKCLDVLLSAVRSPKGWVKLSRDHVIAPRRCQRLADPSIPVTDFADECGRLVVERTDWISVLGDCTIEECREWIVKMRTEGNARGRQFLRPGTILGIVDGYSQKSGVVEIEDVVGEDFCGTL
ncbi:hypothetical protein H2198_004576 [Neophaeococcomyces mojaviensis]|uniref:Uncharacterized protein n=1 Tax=Neophaeococcomyces mojaviensis TaxID=3383035 RepID=A0ACC3A898_9EURO|nr:hypothetical protein H2198_004576 [Knufia sp. JES_112]